ncbi:hypothetical protein J4E89_007405 [Alternaria sp. Ai002NY15]|nr:hypothetical protein J4E89_007405 [Alternaria sp. Ai002NY15]
MPFSVGIGDVIATSRLIKDIIDCLRSAGGAKSEYQELVTELDALKIALDDLSRSGSSTAPSALHDTIKTCHERLDEFWAKIKPYEPSLGSSSRPNALRGTKDKLLWTFCRKEEVVQLQGNLQFYSSIINMHLIRHVAGQMQDMRKDTDAVCRQIAERILDTQGTLADVGKNVSSQGVVASNIQTLVTGLHQFIFDMYQPAYPNNNGFSILICRHQLDRSPSMAATAHMGRRNDRGEEFIMIRAVTLSEPGTKKWTLVAESSKAYFGIIPALQEFTKDLEREMGKMTASMTVGNKRQRSDRDEGSTDQGEYISGYQRKRQR